MGIGATAEVNLNNLRILSTSIHEGMIEGLEIVGGFIVDLASQLAPEETGALKQSGAYKVTGSILEVSFGNDLPDNRATAQEFGTIFMPAQPYLSVAAKEIDVTGEIAKVISGKL